MPRAGEFLVPYRWRRAIEALRRVQCGSMDADGPARARAASLALPLPPKLPTFPGTPKVLLVAREASARDTNLGRRGVSRVSWGGPGTYDCQPAFPLPFLTSGSVPLDNCGAETLPLALC